jgi:hypothetical protein
LRDRRLMKHCPAVVLLLTFVFAACTDSQPLTSAPPVSTSMNSPSDEVADQQGKPFRLLIHCGLSYPVRFRGRYWLPVDNDLRRTHNPPPGFGTDENFDWGLMFVVDSDALVYQSSEGIRVEYEPTNRRPTGCE